jgi:serine/threonine protein phosphatase 1
MIQRFEKNTIGRDFVAGDIHGCFDLLKDKLLEIGFDSEIDRLFSVGDMVDRGKLSTDSLKWITLPWFHSVRGNHEQMAIDYVHGCLDKLLYIRNGGQWFIDLNDGEQKCFAALFEQLPIAIEIETDSGLIGIIHADCPVDDWTILNEKLNGLTKDRFVECCLWERFRISNGISVEVGNINKIYLGHTPVDNPLILGNCVFIDTGAVFNGNLTVIQIN